MVIFSSYPPTYSYLPPTYLHKQQTRHTPRTALLRGYSAWLWQKTSSNLRTQVVASVLTKVRRKRRKRDPTQPATTLFAANTSQHKSQNSISRTSHDLEINDNHHQDISTAPAAIINTIARPSQYHFNSLLSLP